MAKWTGGFHRFGFLLPPSDFLLFLLQVLIGCWCAGGLDDCGNVGFDQLGDFGLLFLDFSLFGRGLGFGGFFLPSASCGLVTDVFVAHGSELPRFGVGGAKRGGITCHGARLTAGTGGKKGGSQKDEGARDDAMEFGGHGGLRFCFGRFK